MSHPKRKLAFFFVAQVLAVGAMNRLVAAALHTPCTSCECEPPSTAAVIMSMLLILGELGIVAAVLQIEGRPMWPAMLAIGIVFWMAAVFVVVVAVIPFGAHAWSILAFWHLVIGLVCVAGGAGAGVLKAWARLR